MPACSNLDDEARAELLCYLVASQLVAQMNTGEWMRTDHRIEADQIWLTANGGICDWSERAALGEMSVNVASRLYALELFTDREIAALFTQGCRLDYRNPATQTLHNICDWYIEARDRRGQ